MGPGPVEHPAQPRPGVDDLSAGSPFSVISCSRLYPTGDVARDESDLRRSIRVTDALLAFGDWLLVAVAGDEEAGSRAAERLSVLGWDVRMVPEPFAGDVSAAAGMLAPRVRPRPERAPRSERLLLLAEYDPEMTYFLRDLLEREGWKVTSVSSAEAAQRAWTETPPDLMILGELPGTDLAALCLRPRLAGLDFPVLICSEDVSAEVRLQAAGAGAPVVSRLNRLYLTAALAALLPG